MSMFGTRSAKRGFLQSHPVHFGLNLSADLLELFLILPGIGVQLRKLAAKRFARLCCPLEGCLGSRFEVRDLANQIAGLASERLLEFVDFLTRLFGCIARSALLLFPLGPHLVNLSLLLNDCRFCLAHLLLAPGKLGGALIHLLIRRIALGPKLLNSLALLGDKLGLFVHPRGAFVKFSAAIDKLLRPVAKLVLERFPRPFSEEKALFALFECYSVGVEPLLLFEDLISPGFEQIFALGDRCCLGVELFGHGAEAFFLRSHLRLKFTKPLDRLLEHLGTLVEHAFRVALPGFLIRQLFSKAFGFLKPLA
jgi:hypothetical protein